MRNLR